MGRWPRWSFPSELLERDPGAVSRVATAAREAGVLVRPLARAIAVSPPLTATPEHFSLIAEAIDHGLGESGWARAGRG